MTEEEIITELEHMQVDKGLVTKSAYRANSELWPGNRISFIESHMAYIKLHPSVDPRHYISNLKLMLRKNPKI